jgi:CheY-like chemotaxis protein
LINDILDLSKIEAGRIEVHLEEIPVRSVGEGMIEAFKHLADEKNLSLEFSIREDCPGRIWTDRKRLEQILKNLISNAIKFTEKGSISVSMGRSDEGVYLSKDLEHGFAVTVRDTGIGIPREKQKIIFDAFQQLDGGVSRKYGGTGLGLSISRELARLLGGEIRLASEPGKGSAFTLYLPVEKRAGEKNISQPVAYAPFGSAEPEKESASAVSEMEGEYIPDDRGSLHEDDQGILIIEDDRRFAGLLVDQCRKRGLKCLFAATGEEGLRLAREHLPKGIILDIRLPGRDGWSVLDDLKGSPGTRHIPVHIMSVEDATLEALRRGAVGFLTKPVKKEEMEDALSRLEHMFSRDIKDVLIVEDDEQLRSAMVKLIAGSDVNIDEAASAADAINAIRSGRYDCIILDLGLPDMNGLEMLRRLEAEKGIQVPPVIVYTGRELTQEEEAELRNYSDSIIVKGVRSEERLLDEACLFLHRMVSKMPEKKRQIITNLHDTDTMFQGRQALIVDDDMRNAFALSRVLEGKGMTTLKAENGKKALELLENNPSPDLVLMDIMMPGMDGYETMKWIRAQERFTKLPIIALTAKAMRQDRERCLAAGANDYLAKPVDLDRLLSMMRVWLYR